MIYVALALPKAPSESLGGLPASEMTSAQVELLATSSRRMLTTCRPQWLSRALDAFHQAGVEKIQFAWAGADKPGVGHYYVLQGPTFVIEFVNTQPDSAGNPANHIHSLCATCREILGRAYDRPRAAYHELLS